jgi:hypothetical protein
MSEPISDEDLERLADKLLAKMLSRLARRAAQGSLTEPPPAPHKRPSPEAFARVEELRQRRVGRRRR